MNLIGILELFCNNRMLMGLEIEKVEDGVERSAMEDEAFSISPPTRVCSGYF